MIRIGPGTGEPTGGDSTGVGGVGGAGSGGGDLGSGGQTPEEQGPCPDLFDLSKLYVKSWCGYTCVVGKNIVGSAIVFTSKFKSLSEKVCLPN